MQKIIQTNQEEVMCNGKDICLGHPKIFMHIGRTRCARCLYCRTVYVFQDQSTDDMQNKNTRTQQDTQKPNQSILT